MEQLITNNEINLNGEPLICASEEVGAAIDFSQTITDLVFLAEPKYASLVNEIITHQLTVDPEGIGKSSVTLTNEIYRVSTSRVLSSVVNIDEDTYPYKVSVLNPGQVITWYTLLNQASQEARNLMSNLTTGIQTKTIPTQVALAEWVLRSDERPVIKGLFAGFDKFPQYLTAQQVGVETEDSAFRFNPAAHGPARAKIGNFLKDNSFVEGKIVGNKLYWELKDKHIIEVLRLLYSGVQVMRGDLSQTTPQNLSTDAIDGFLTTIGNLK